MSLTSSGAMACSVSMLNGVSHQSPLDTLKAFLRLYPVRLQKYSFKEKKYVQEPAVTQIHVVFGGPDMTTLSPTNGHYSKVGSCNAFAAFLRENSLGTVVESPPRHNPLHSERADGEGDVIVYIWTPDPKALLEWSDKNMK